MKRPTPAARTLALLVLISCLIPLSSDLLAQGGSGRGKPTRPAASPAAGEVPKKIADAVILEVGSEKFTVAQIADAYKRNANRGGKSFYELDRDSARAFLDLYARYRLKVQAAMAEGLDRKPEIIEELENNRMQLAVPPAPQSGYLIERKVVDPALRRIFDLRKDEVRIGVIFSAMRTNDPGDTLRAFNRTMEMFRRLSMGESFEKMALDSSDDRQFQAMGGKMWITGGMLFPEMEAAAYETKPGEMYPGAVRVPSGFVLIKVYDRSQRRRVRASHIFFNTQGPDSMALLTSARAVADSALRLVRSGRPFEEVARALSQDQTSGANGGDLGSPYTRSLGFEAASGRLWTEFEDAMFALKEGEVSGIVQTGVGYHIIKVVESKLPVFEDEKEMIRSFYKQQLLADDRAAYVRGVLEKQGYRLDLTTLNRLLASVNQNGTTADTAWAARIDGALRSQPLFTFRGTPYTVGAWIDSVETRRELRATALNQRGVRSSVEVLLEPLALAEEAKTLERDYPEFAALMREFRDGILIFKLEEDLIWSKLKYDEEEGQKFFEANRARYNTDPQLALTEIFLYKQADAQNAFERVKANPALFDSVARTETQRSGFRDKGGKWALSGPKHADIVKQVMERSKNPAVGSILEPFEYQGGWSIVRIDESAPVRPMTYEEAKPEVMGDFIDHLQQKLTDEWIGRLRQTFRVAIDQRALDQALAAGASMPKDAGDTAARPVRIQR